MYCEEFYTVRERRATFDRVDTASGVESRENQPLTLELFDESPVLSGLPVCWMTDIIDASMQAWVGLAAALVFAVHVCVLQILGASQLEEQVRGWPCFADAREGRYRLALVPHKWSH